MRTFIYGVWALLPLFFFLMALWAKLEQISDKQRKQNPGDLVKQGAFVLVCVLVSILIDQFVLESLAESIAPSIIPLGFYQVILLPVVLLIAAKIAGPTKAVSITKSPHPTQNRKKGQR